MFVDKVTIFVKAGNGGNGCSAFHREKFVPKGGPSGGNGGRGGDVVFLATSKEQSLIDLKYQPIVKARNGGDGSSANKHGAKAESCIVKVPLGTVVRDIDRDREVLVDLSEEGQTFVVCNGGKGGFGNRHFQSNENKLPRTCTDGDLGEERNLELELKTLADIGLVGFPNAGKSTLITAITKAHPKVAPYPFTTRHPVVGIIEYEDFSRITVADIPGLVEGAHDNRGLGHEFLRHIERTKVLVYVLDMACTDNRHPVADFHALQEELELYREGITATESLIIANKMDEERSKETIMELREAVSLPIFECVAELGEGVKKFTEYLHDLFKNKELKTACPSDAVVEEIVDVFLPNDDEDEDDFWEF
ncbi:MAG: GTPase ObgE [Lentisphaeria bacterium]